MTRRGVLYARLDWRLQRAASTIMRMSTRGHPYVCPGIVLRDGRARARTSFCTALHAAEHNQDNAIFQVEYTARCLRVMLLAHYDEHNNVELAMKKHVRKLFETRTAWKLGTIFRAVFCRLFFFKTVSTTKDGSLLLQANTECVGFDLCRLLFEGSGAPPLDLHYANKCIAQMNWSQDLDSELFQIRQTSTFLENEAFLTPNTLVNCNLIPTHMRDNINLFRTVREAIAICASFRMWRDGLSACGAISLVVSMQGLSADFFT